MDILTLKEKDLRNCSLSETIEIIDEISRIVTELHGNVKPTSEEIVEFTEISDELYSKITTLQNKVLEDAFSEKLPKKWKEQKEALLSKLFSIIIVVQSIRDSVRVWITINESTKHLDELKRKQQALVEDYDTKKKNLECHIEEIEKNEEKIKIVLEEQKEAIRTTSEETLEEIQGAEGKIVSHVLTLMGVFSAVITIILSIVVTSSSWLNSANNSSAIVAFVIPNMVALFAVISVVLLVYMYHKAFYPPSIKPGQSESKVPTVVSAILLGAILFITIVVSVLAYRYTDVDNGLHLRYVIHDTDYKVVEESEGNPLGKCFEFTIDDKIHQFAYDENKLHQTDIHYCVEHNALE